VLAAKWANDFVRMANDNLRDRAIAESERNISYLNEQAAKTDVVGIRQTIYNIMETEINKAMLAKGSEEYAFKIIDPAVVPEKPYSPRPRLWTLASLLGTLLLSVAVAFVRIAWKKN
jgi:LPS O-antigen subunit length determinant protein (WzzB/FepE family)